jgi:outer membrane protein OmpA-like peptidoglycan-associated protein
MTTVLPATIPQDERARWSVWAVCALVLSLVSHVLLFLLLRGTLLGWGRPLVDPIEPARFRLERTSIDPRYLREEAQRTMGHQSEAERSPIELEPGEVASFAGPLEAPRIPLPVLKGEPQSLSLEAVANPRDGLTALPLETQGVFKQQSQALAGGQGGGPVGKGLPGSEEISALMRPEFADPNVAARTPLQPILVRISSELLFAFDSCDLTQQGMAKLQRVADYLRQAAEVRATIEGHTDSIGDDAYNQNLSEQRARVVAQWLASAGGVPAERMAVQGYGENRPIVPQTGDRDMERLNRRVEIRIEGVR